MLRPVITSLTHWAAKAPEFQPERQLILLQIFNGALITLKEYFVPFIQMYFEPVLLAGFTFSAKCLAVKTDKKRSHDEASHGVPDLDPLLLPQLLTLVMHNFKFDSSNALTSDHYERLIQPICTIVDLPLSKDLQIN